MGRQGMGHGAEGMGKRAPEFGPPWRDGLYHRHPTGTPEELPPLSTILIKQVWAREFEIKKGNVIDFILFIIAFNAQSLTRGSLLVSRNL